MESPRTTTDTTPPGWSYDPSAWGQRLPIIALALVGFGIATYLALYQWGVFSTVWEPFFGRGSERVLHSSVSRALPIPDAALGALGYLLDAVSGAIGGRGRWRTLPWVVIVFGIAVGPLGAVSILLVILQPVLVHGWCTLCLASAVISVIMIGPAMDELLASLQHERQAVGVVGHASGVGRVPAHGRMASGTAAMRTPTPPRRLTPDVRRPLVDARSSVSILLGLWLMAAPAILDYTGPAAVHFRIVGPVVAAIATIALWEITQPVRWANVLCGAWLIVAPWIFGFTTGALINSVNVGVVLIAVTLPRGARTQRYGGGWASLLPGGEAGWLP
jgi:uncharacterized membrane protein